jgi:hypothetical protein
VADRETHINGLERLVGFSDGSARLPFGYPTLTETENDKPQQQ